MKDPLKLFVNGWCENCECEPAECIKLGKCKGDNDEETETEKDNE